MRSKLVFGAKVRVPNRYQLAVVLSLATRALHKPGTRIQDTMNSALLRLTTADPIATPQVDREAVRNPATNRPVHPSWNPEALTELRRILGDGTGEVSASLATASADSLDGMALR